MTAAVIPSALLPPLPAPPPAAPDGQTDTPPVAPLAGRRARNTPYLTPVPDCEPPFDDEPRQRENPTWMTAFPSVGQHPVDVDPDPGQHMTPAGGPSFIEAGPGTGTASANDPSAAGAEPIGSIPAEPAGRYSGLQSPTADGRPALPSEPRQSATSPRAPRSGRSPALRSPVQTDVLLLEPKRTARPTTITAPGVPGWSSEADIGVRKTASEHLPHAERAASVLARALVEVLSGQRPLPQLRVHCAPEIYAGLGRRPRPAPKALPHLLTVRVCEPADGAAEVSVVFRRAERVRALAFRMEGVDGRWRIMALQLG